METIDVKTDIYKYDLGAAEECKVALLSLGIKYVHIDQQRGAHGAEIWISDDYKEKFETEILNKKVVGSYREFYFTKISMFGRHSLSYYVSYVKKHLS